MGSSAGVGFPNAIAADRASASAAFRGTGASAWGSGLGFSGRRREHPGGEAEQRKTRVAQEAAASESYLRELFVVDRCFEFSHLGLVQRHTRLPPFDSFLLCDLHQVALLSRGTFGSHELDQGGGASEEMDFSGYRPALDFQDERRAFEIQRLGQPGRLGI